MPLLFGVDFGTRTWRSADVTNIRKTVPCAVTWTADGAPLVGSSNMANADSNNIAQHLHDVLGKPCPPGAQLPLVDCHGKAFFRIRLDATHERDYSPEEAVAALLAHTTPVGAAVVMALPHDMHANEAQQGGLRRAALIADRRLVGTVKSTTALAIRVATMQKEEDEGMRHVVVLIAPDDENVQNVDVARFSIHQQILTPLVETRLSLPDVASTTLVQDGDAVWVCGALAARLPDSWSISQFTRDEMARGAALHAAVLMDDATTTKDIYIIAPPPSVDRAPAALAWSLGVETAGDVMSVLLPRGTVLPARKVVDVARLEPSSTGLSIVVLLGERARASDNRRIALFAVEDVDPAAPPQRMTLTFTIASDLVLHVTAHLYFRPADGCDNWTEQWHVPLAAFSCRVEATEADAALRRRWEAQSLYQHVLWHVRATHKLASSTWLDRLAEEQAWLHALPAQPVENTETTEACERRAAAWLSAQVADDDDT